MAIDKGYGSGKPRSAANSSMRRRAAAGQMTKGKKKMGQLGSYKTPGLAAANRRTSDSLLEAFTGFNKKDGVDAGDFAGLAISIPTAGLGGALLRGGARVAKMAIPKATRVAKAATRLSKSAKASLTANQMQNKYYLGKVDEAMSEWYSARNLPNPTRGELMTPANKEMYSRWGAEKTRKAADAIEQSGRLDPEINADRLLGRLEQFKYLKKRRGGR